MAWNDLSERGLYHYLQALDEANAELYARLEALRRDAILRGLTPDSWSIRRVEARLQQVSEEVERVRRVVLGAQGADGLAASAGEDAYAFGLRLTQRVLQRQGVGAEFGLETFNAVHLPQARAIAQELTDGFDQAYSRATLGEQQAYRAVGRLIRSQPDVFRKVQAEQAMRGILLGEDIGKTGGRIWNDFVQRGITGFVDARERQWRLDAYAAMLARTTTAKAGRLAERMACREWGIDLAKLVGGVGSTTCVPCDKWDGRVCSWEGKTAGYPTVEEAEAEGVGHPNCHHQWVAYLEGGEGLSPAAMGEIARELSEEFGADVPEVEYMLRRAA